MKQRLKIAAVMLSLLLPLPLFALDLSLETALKMAESADISLMNAKLDTLASIEDDRNDYFVLLPSLSASATIVRQNEGTVTAFGAIPNNPALSFQVGASYAFNPAMVTSLKVAPINTEISRLEEARIKEETATNVKKLYYAILFQNEALEIQRGTLSNYEERLAQAEDKQKQGYATDLDVMKARVDWESKMADVAKQEASIESQKLSLKFLLGIDFEEPLNLTGNLDVLFDSSTPLAAATTVNEQKLSKQLELLTLNEKMLKEQLYFPNVILQASWQPTLGDMTGSWEKDNWSDNGSMMVTVSFNLTDMLPCSTKQGNIRDVQTSITKINNSLKMIESSSELSLRQAKENIASIEKAIEQNGRTVALAEASLNMSRDLYDAGYLELLDLKDAESRLELAKLSLISERFNLITALIDLETVTRETYI
jgi:Outer membrane protein